MPGAGGDLSWLRREFYQCLPRRADALFELCDAVLCADGPVGSIAALSLAGEHRRGHGSGYAAPARGRIDVQRLRTALTAVAVPRAADGRLVLAVDITSWLRPEAHTSSQRILCHTYGRGKDQHMMIPGWPYSVVVALETGRSSWTAPLDAIRLAPGMDAAGVTAAQVRDVVDRLTTAGHWQPGDPDILLVPETSLEHLGGDGGGSDRRAVAVAAHRQKPGRPPQWTQRQLINGIRWRIRAGAPWRDVPPAYGPWQTVYGVVPALATRWCLEADPRWSAGSRGCRWVDRLGCDCGFHDQPGAPARGRCASKGDLQVEPPGGIDTEPADTGSVARVAGSLRRPIWPPNRARSRCRCW